MLTLVTELVCPYDELDLMGRLGRYYLMIILCITSSIVYYECMELS